MEYELIADETSVKFWSDVRLPFEPKGDVRAMRDVLRVALARLRGPRLRASFGGIAGAAFDIENVLFYNVGCSAFRGCAQTELYFERRFAPAMAPSGRAWLWSHEYRIDELCKSWAPSGHKAELRLSGNGAIPTTAAEYWRAAHLARSGDGQRLSVSAPLFLSLQLSSPRPVNLTEAVKKVTDGICSALHSYEGSRLEAVAARAATSLQVSPAVATEWLTRHGALGPRQFVWPYRQSLQWSPADERLVAVEMSWSTSGLNAWTMAVELSGAEPTAP